MTTHSSVLARRIPGTGEAGGLPSMGSHRVRHNWSNLAAAAAGVYVDVIWLSKAVSKNNFMKITSAYDMVQGDRDMNNEFKIYMIYFISDLMPCINSVAQSCPTLWDPMNRSTPGLPVHHQLLEFTQTHIYQVSDVIQPSHPLSSPSPPAPNPSQHQSLFQWVNSLHEVAKVLEFQLQHHSFQRNPRTNLL